MSPDRGSSIQKPLKMILLIPSLFLCLFIIHLIWQKIMWTSQLFARTYAHKHWRWMLSILIWNIERIVFEQVFFLNKQLKISYERLCCTQKCLYKCLQVLCSEARTQTTVSLIKRVLALEMLNGFVVIMQSRKSKWRVLLLWIYKVKGEIKRLI